MSDEISIKLSVSIGFVRVEGVAVDGIKLEWTKDLEKVMPSRSEITLETSLLNTPFKLFGLKTLDDNIAFSKGRCVGWDQVDGAKCYISLAHNTYCQIPYEDKELMDVFWAKDWRHIDKGLWHYWCKVHSYHLKSPYSSKFGRKKA